MLWHPSPPQGESSAQGLNIIGKPLSPKFGAPQGIASGDVTPPTTNAWVDDLGNEFNDDLSNVVVFEI